MYDAACALRDAMIELQVAVDGGKDSLSMAAAAGGETVMAPGNLVVSAYVPCPDITKVCVGVRACGGVLAGRQAGRRMCCLGRLRSRVQSARRRHLSCPLPPPPSPLQVVTPDLKAPGRSSLLHVDLGAGRRRLGGSALAQAYAQVGD